MTRFIALLLGLLLSSVCIAQHTSINVVGYDDGTAISGYDVVAFHTVKKTIRGDPQFAHNYLKTRSDRIIYSLLVSDRISPLGAIRECPLCISTTGSNGSQVRVRPIEQPPFESIYD